jgi:hypothetical protein
MDGCVDDQDYNDGAQNDHPIGKLSARYRCLFAKPFHDYPPIFKQRLTKGEAPTEGSGPFPGGKMLTIRARVKADLEALRERSLPGLGKIAENAALDYRYRAKAPRDQVAEALARMVQDIDYANFSRPCNIAARR